MNEEKVWLITGAARGLGLHIAKAVLAAGHAVVATARDAAKAKAAIGDHAKLLALKLDVTRPEDAEGAVEAAVLKFGRIDVLVNNAGNFFAGFFEELSPEQVRNQIETLLFGPMNVTRAVLPVMRKQRSGLLVTISSTAGISGQMFCTAYAAAKFGIEGWMESLTPEIAPFGIRTIATSPKNDLETLQKELASAEREQKVLKDKLERLLNLYLEGNLPQASYVVKTGQLEREAEANAQTRVALQQKIQSHGKKEGAADLIQTLRVLARSHRRFTEEQKTKVFRSIIKEARLTTSGVELEMYVQPTHNVWWKYRQKTTAPSRTTRVPAQTIRIRTKQALARP